MSASNPPTYETLLNYLKPFKNAAIAFSGGVDSTFLLQAARDAIGDNVLAMTINSPYIPDWEIEEAKELVKRLQVRQIIVNAGIAEPIRNNPKDRCYLCKTFIFNILKEVAKSNGFDHVMDGTNAEDSEDDRPGMKALRELNIISPLRETGFTKKEIRHYSKIKDLPTWEKPAYACLLTRLPYDEQIDLEDLKRIEKSELYLIEMGIRSVRVRAHKNLARIETSPENIVCIFKENLMDKISRQLKRYGFQYVTLDLEGYRSGDFTGIFKK
jgi:uncharacterized protein